MFHWTVIEVKQQINITSADGRPIIKPCWNIVFKVPYSDEDQAQSSFDGCLVWLENNKVDGSKYVITEMYFYE